MDQLLSLIVDPVILTTLKTIRANPNGNVRHNRLFFDSVYHDIILANHRYSDPTTASSLERTLKQLAKSKPIPQLFARLAILKALEDRDVPDNYPDLVVSYVDGLRIGCDRPRPIDFRRAAFLVGYWCVTKDLMPRQVPAELLRSELTEASSDLPFSNDTAEGIAPDIMFDELVRSGLLVLIGRTDQVRVVHDIIAEYLAAWHCFRQEKRTLVGTVRGHIAKKRTSDSRAGAGLAEALTQVEVVLNRLATANT